MIESWLQITCNGCEGTTEQASEPNITYAAFRAEMAGYGWRSVGALDYCRYCVMTGRYKERVDWISLKPMTAPSPPSSLPAP